MNQYLVHVSAMHYDDLVNKINDQIEENNNSQKIY
jgi:hypothetical protein